MNVIGYDPYINEERAKAMGVTVGTLDDVIEKSDFITVHMPLNQDTKDMLDEKAIARMKKGVRLVNCARGGIINEAALAEAVKSGHVAGAAVDVFTSEPIEEGNPLVGVEGIILTPHLGASTVEAQIGVALDVAEGIRAALSGEPVMTAVNMAPVSADVMHVIRPYLDLAERLGCTVCSLADGAITELSVEYSGDITEVNTQMLTTGVIKGMLNPVLEFNVNYVNAPSLAKERSIKVREIKHKESQDFQNLISVCVKTAKGEVTVKGTLFGTEGRIVSIGGYRVDVDPHDRILICPHINRPGVIGTVGTLMGQHGINISSMQVGRTDKEGTNVMVLTIDHDIPEDLLQKITAVDGIFGARLVNFHAV